MYVYWGVKILGSRCIPPTGEIDFWASAIWLRKMRIGACRTKAVLRSGYFYHNWQAGRKKKEGQDYRDFQD
jgi:hypothetical protein